MVFVKHLLAECMCLITLAPEIVGNEVLRELMSEHACVISVGHSEASYDRMREVIRLGIRGVTHAFNGHPPIQARNPGLLCAALETQNVWISVIVDGVHVELPVLRILKSMSYGPRLLLISDSMPVAGIGEKEFALGEHVVRLRDDTCYAEDGTLCGTGLNIATSIQNCVQKIGIPLDESLRMGTLYPAQFMRIDKNFGRLDTGYVADLVCFNNQLEILWVMRDGQIIS